MITKYVSVEGLGVVAQGRSYMRTPGTEVSSDLRARLLAALARLRQSEIGVGEFLKEFDALEREGLQRSLGDRDRKAVTVFAIWYAGMYDSARPPRAGLWGRLRDWWDAFIKGEYRVSTDALVHKASDLERRLAGHEVPPGSAGLRAEGAGRS